MQKNNSYFFQDAQIFLHPNFSHLETWIHDVQIVRFETFSDGWPRIFLEEKWMLEGKKVVYIGDFLDVGSFFSQMAFLDGLLRHHITRLDIIVPFLAVASMERDTPSGELGVASLFCRIFGVLGERLPGAVHIHLYDIHDEREIHYFPPNLQIHHHTTMDLLKKKISLAQKPVILFPDSGAKKAFSRFFSDYDTVACSKIRRSPTDIDIYFEWGNMKWRDIIIIDDHIRSWGTLMEACRAVRAHGALHVSAFVPHAVFSSGIPEDFLKVFDVFYTTDSISENFHRFENNPTVHIFNFLEQS
jgi:ribose-phosphate pyrophosphokinase